MISQYGERLRQRIGNAFDDISRQRDVTFHSFKEYAEQNLIESSRN